MAYTNLDFTDDSQKLAREVFQTCEWLIVIVAVRYAHTKIGGDFLEMTYYVLTLLLGIYLSVAASKFLRWAFPTVVPTKGASWKTMCAALAAVFLSLAAMSITEKLSDALVVAQLKNDQAPSVTK